MKKVSLILFSLLLFLIIPNVDALELNSKYAVLYNLEDNTILYEKQKDKKTSIASLTKIMTTLVAIENIDNYNEEVIIKKEMFESLDGTGAYVMGLKDGMRVTYDDLLYGMFLTSGADATVAIAQKTAGSEEDFVKLMNKKVKELGLKNTNFTNPVGLDDEMHYSTVNEVAIILKEALKNKKFKEVFTTKSYTFKNEELTITNSLHKLAKRLDVDDSYIIGSKTGYTGNAGHALASVSIDKKNNIKYLLVTTNAESNPAYLEDATNTYKYYFYNYKYQNIVKKNDLILTLPVEYSKKKKMKFYAKESVKYYLKNNYSKKNISLKYEGKKVVTPKMKKNEKIGKIHVLYKNKEIDTIDIKIDKKVSYSIIGFISYHFHYIVIITILIIIYLTYKNKKAKRKKKITYRKIV